MFAILWLKNVCVKLRTQFWTTHFHFWSDVMDFDYNILQTKVANWQFFVHGNVRYLGESTSYLMTKTPSHHARDHPHGPSKCYLIEGPEPHWVWYGLGHFSSNLLLLGHFVHQIMYTFYVPVISWNKRTYLHLFIQSTGHLTWMRCKLTWRHEQSEQFVVMCYHQMPEESLT